MVDVDRRAERVDAELASNIPFVGIVRRGSLSV
jgi:hypothetical protein